MNMPQKSSFDAGRNRAKRSSDIFEMETHKKTKLNDGDSISMVSVPTSNSSSRMSKVSDNPYNQLLLEAMEAYFQHKTEGFDEEESQEYAASELLSDFEAWITSEDKNLCKPTMNLFGRFLTVFKTRGGIIKRRGKGSFYVIKKNYWSV